MKSFHYLGLACALGLVCAPAAWAQNPSLLPLPTVEQSDASPYAADARGPAYTAALPNEGGLVRRGWSMASTPSEAPSPSDSVGPGARLNAAPQPEPAPQPSGDVYHDGYYSNGWGSDVHGGGLLGHGGGHGFYAWGGALLMTRVSPRAVSLAYDDANPSADVLTTNDRDGMWSGGFEVGLGFQCGACSRAEILYWAVYPGCQGAGIRDIDVVGNLNSRLDFDPLTFTDNNANEAPVNDWYQGSSLQWYTKEWTIQNVEANFWQGACCFGGCGGCGSMMGVGQYGGCTGGCGDCCAPSCNRLNLQFLAGIRWFGFDEEFQYHADANNEDPFYRILTSNSLIGFQVGGRIDYLVGQRWAFFATPKFGVYNNSVRMGQTVNHPESPWVDGPTSGAAAVDSTNPVNGGQVYDVTSSEDQVSFIGQVDFGGTYYFTPNWNLSAGYRVVAISNVAITTDQIPSDFGNIDGVADIKADSSLILHGFFLQTQYMW